MNHEITYMERQLILLKHQIEVVASCANEVGISIECMDSIITMQQELSNIENKLSVEKAFESMEAVADESYY